MKNLLVAIVAIALASAVLLAVRASPVQAQETDCEEVTYNGRLVTRCTTRSGDGETPDPSSGGGASGGSSDDPSGAPSAPGDDEDDESIIDRVETQVDRGERGGRRGIEAYETETEDEAEVEGAADEADADDEAATDSDGSDTEDEEVAIDDSESQDDDASNDAADGSDSDDTSESASGSTGAADDNSGGNAALVFTLAALMLIGALFLLASTRARRKRLDVAPPTSDDGQSS